MSEDAELGGFEEIEGDDENKCIETAAGKIPVDWETKNVKEFCELQNGKATNHVDVGEEPHLVYGSNGPIGSYSESNFDGGLIFGRVGAVGEVERVSEQVWVSDNAIRAQVADEVNTDYLYYHLTNRELSALATKTAQPLLNQSTIGNISVPEPPLEEQRKIASVLYNIDQAIEKTEEIREQRVRVKRGLMQDLFRFGVDKNGVLRYSTDESTPYRETKYGTIPKEWSIVPLNQIVPDDAPVVYGILKPGDHHPNGVPVVKVKDIEDGQIKQDDILCTSPEIHENFKRAELQEGDLLFTIRGTVGRMAFVPEELEGGNITQDTARVRIEGANPQFVRYYFETATPNNYFERNTIGQAVQGINLEDLREVPVHLPSEDEQERIVGIIDSHTETIEQERRSLDQLQRLKQGLMQDLLSGEVRTTDADIEVLDEVAQHG